MSVDSSPGIIRNTQNILYIHCWGENTRDLVVPVTRALPLLLLLDRSFQIRSLYRELLFFVLKTKFYDGRARIFQKTIQEFSGKIRVFFANLGGRRKPWRRRGTPFDRVGITRSLAFFVPRRELSTRGTRLGFSLFSRSRSFFFFFLPNPLYRRPCFSPVSLKKKISRDLIRRARNMSCQP